MSMRSANREEIHKNTPDGRVIIHKACHAGEQEALTALRKNGFTDCPEFLGVDSGGQACYAVPSGYTADENARMTKKQFLHFMRMLRRMHDASRPFSSEDWVICHHNLSPQSVLFDLPCDYLGSLPRAVIAWDFCGPGHRWEDIVFVCWLWLGIGGVPSDGERYRDFPFPPNDADILQTIREGLDAYAGEDRQLRWEIGRDFDGRLGARMEAVMVFTEENKGDILKTRRLVNAGQQWVANHRGELRKAAEIECPPVIQRREKTDRGKEKC